MRRAADSCNDWRDWLGCRPRVSASAQTGQSSAGDYPFLPHYARAQNYRSLKQSSFDRTGGNADSWPIQPGATRELFASEGPGVITHIWFTIAAESSNHLKEIVIRIYWDGHAKPSVEVPVGDFFGLNLGQYFVYQSAFLNCSSVKALNCYFAMPFRRSARITATNESERRVDAFYSNIDYQIVPALPDEVLYFHAQYRQAAPNKPTTNDWRTNGDADKLKNLDGKDNYVFAETRGRGHLMGVTLGVLQNQDYWMGEGDEMVFVDDESHPVITGTGTEDYFNGAWDFGGRDTAVPFAHLYNGAPFIVGGGARREAGTACTAGTPTIRSLSRSILSTPSSTATPITARITTFRWLIGIRPDPIPTFRRCRPRRAASPG